MTIDTPAKRFSAIHHGNPWRGVATLPTGTIGQASRQSVLWMYSGVLFSGPATLVYGPVCYPAGTVFHQGAKFATVQHPGGKAATLFHPGGKAATTT